MAMPQRDDPPSRCALRRTSTIEAIKRLDACGRLRALRVRRWRISPPKRSFCGASLEYAVMHGDEKEAERIREELRKLTESARLATLRDFLLPLLMNGQVKIGDVE